VPKDPWYLDKTLRNNAIQALSGLLELMSLNFRDDTGSTSAMSLLDRNIDSSSLRCAQAPERCGQEPVTEFAPAVHGGNDNPTMMSVGGENVRFIFGMPRSGTSWLAKIFDSHPDVLYRHEPDIVLRDAGFPTFCRFEEIESFRDHASAYLDQLVNVRTLKAAGSLPLFPKRYQNPLAQYLRLVMVYRLRLAETFLPSDRWSRYIQNPGLVKRQYQLTPTVVIKSVSACGRARLYTEALPASRTIFIIRHPCGQVASMMRGIALGKLTGNPGVPLSADHVSRFGLTARKFDAMPLAEKLAWSWAIMNQKVLDDLSGNPRVRIVRYRDLCAEPAKIARDLLVFSGLSWEPQTADFIERSTHYSGPDRYYKVMKNSVAALNRWRTELSLDDQRRILVIANQVPAGGMFLD